MAEGSWSHISPSSKHFWHRTTHPPPKQTSQKPGWAKEKKMKGVEEKFQDQSFWRKRQLQAKSLVSYLFFLSALTDRSSRNRLVLDQHTYIGPPKKTWFWGLPQRNAKCRKSSHFFTSNRNMVWKNILEIWREISFLEISSVFKDIVLAISEFYPLAQWRANTAGHSHNKWTTQKYMNVTKKTPKNIRLNRIHASPHVSCFW